jgi:hypothetical protein
MTRFKTAATSALIIIGLTAVAQADDVSETVYQITPYVWASGLGGDIAPRSNTQVSIDKSASDVLQDLDAAFFVSGFARHGNLVFVGDFSISSSSRSGMTPSPPAPGPLPATGKLRQSSVTALGGYRVASTPEATFDILGGLRHWSLRGEVDIPSVPSLGFPGASATRSAGFTDPIVAVRGNLLITEGWSVLFHVDAGGFGIGSHRTAQLLGSVNYQLSHNAFLSAGYRHLHVDYRSGETRFDMHMSGPILGASIQF